MVKMLREIFRGQLVRRMAAFLMVMAIPSGAARAHGGEPLAPHDLWNAWNWDLSLLLGLGLSAWFYGRGLANLWARAGKDRGISRRQAIRFAIGILSLFVALVSPLDAMGEVLFSAHMVQHLLLILVAAPLLVLGSPQIAFTWGIPTAWRPRFGRWWHRRVSPHESLARLGRVFTNPLIVWALHVAALWFWHMPGFYQAAIRDEGIHILEHLCFTGTALLFWWVAIRRDRLDSGATALYIFTMALQSGLLGALITFSSSVWYGMYEASAPLWGLTALDDQQLAGVIMWVPGNAVYLAALLWILWDWFHRMETRDSQLEGRFEVSNPGGLLENTPARPGDRLPPVEGG